MFVKRATYFALVEERAVASALSSTLRAECRKREVEVLTARAEIKRLTNVIIELKDRGMVLAPGHGDEEWGRYVMDEKPASEMPPTPSPDEREAAIGEAEFHADLAAALGEVTAG